MFVPNIGFGMPRNFAICRWMHRKIRIWVPDREIGPPPPAPARCTPPLLYHISRQMSISKLKKNCTKNSGRFLYPKDLQKGIKKFVKGFCNLISPKNSSFFQKPINKSFHFNNPLFPNHHQNNRLPHPTLMRNHHIHKKDSFLSNHGRN